MTTITADSNGHLHGQFTIPAGIRPGTKTVNIVGAYGSIASAYYTAEGQTLDVSQSQLSVTVTQPPPPPPPRPAVLALVNDTYVTNKNVTLTINSASGVLTNDAASNGGVIPHIIGNTQPSHGTVALSADGSFVYVPTTNYVGNDQFTYSAVLQSTGATGVATVSIRVVDNGNNSGPVATPDTYEVVSGHVLSGVNVCANDSSPSGRTFAVTSHTAPTKGVASLFDNGLMNYTPNVGIGASAPETDSFSYTITDTDGHTATASVTITITPPQVTAAPAPIARDDVYYWSARPQHDPSVQDLTADLTAVYGVGNPQIATILAAIQFQWIDQGLYPINVVGNDTYTGSPKIVSFSQPASQAVTGTAAPNVSALRPSSCRDASVLAAWWTEQASALKAVLSRAPTESELLAYADGRFIIYAMQAPGWQMSAGSPEQTKNGLWNDSFSYVLSDDSGKTSTARVSITWAFPWTDPIAETFVSDRLVQVWGVDIHLATLGNTPVMIELRETAQGVPVRAPLRRAILQPSQTTVGWNRFLFDLPYTCAPNADYCVVVLCDDAQTVASVAVQGQYDPATGTWVTAQPYSVGVFLASSNNATWSARQDTDLTFRVLSKTFSTTTKRITLGSVTLAGDTDFRVSAHYDIPADGCAVQFELTMPDGGVYLVGPEQPLALAAGQTGSMAVVAVLTGTGDFSPVLHRDVQVLHGPIGTTGTYVSRAMPAGPGSRVMVIFRGYFPSGSSVLVELDELVNGNPADNWVTMTQLGVSADDNGFVEATYQLSGVNADTVKVRLTLSGSAAARPKVRDLRMMVM